jgi:DNA-directed RNA polymerase subunit RPC12/RpoP
MKQRCPHCNAEFDLAVDNEQELDTAVPCPTCGKEVPTGPQSSIDIDVELDLGEAEESGTAAADPEAGFGGDGETTPVFDGDHDAASVFDEDSDAEDTGDEETSVASEKSVGESSSPGFDQDQEVSQLQDVDLNMAGTYHRTGRVLHHATDVVWTGKRRKVKKERGEAESAEEGPAEEGPPVVAEERPAEEGPGEATPAEAVEDPLAATSSFELEEELTTGSEGASADSMGELADDPFAMFDLDDSEIDDEDAMDAGASPKLEEMDFSSLLDEASGSHSGLFDNDSNPFKDLSLPADEDDDELAKLLSNLEVSDTSGQFESDDETMTFFIEAPDAAEGGADPLELDLGDGAYDIELPADKQPPKRKRALAPQPPQARTL